MHMQPAKDKKKRVRQVLAGAIIIIAIMVLAVIFNGVTPAPTSSTSQNVTPLVSSETTAISSATTTAVPTASTTSSASGTATTTGTSSSNMSTASGSNKWTSWHKAISKVPLPHAGCFTIAYPSLVWKQAQCTAPPTRPLSPSHASAEQPALVGSPLGGDWMETQTGNSALIGESSGSFYSAPDNPSFSEHDNQTGGNNDFSIQLNTNTFIMTGGTPYTSCNGLPIPSCVSIGSVYSGSTVLPCDGSPPFGSINQCIGWVQFALTNSVNSFCILSICTNWPEIVTAYWLLGYYQTYGFCPGVSIPGGNLETPGTWSDDGGSCLAWGPAYGLQGFGIGNLGQIVLNGYTNWPGGFDVVQLCFDGETPCSIAAAPTAVLDLNQYWTQTEFNVFGLGGGSQAVFSPDTTFVVQITSMDQSGNPIQSPKCFKDTTTQETNNLNLFSCYIYSDGEIVFVESNEANPAVSLPPVPTATLATGIDPDSVGFGVVDVTVPGQAGVSVCSTSISAGGCTYQELPQYLVSVTAQAKPGYLFNGWETINSGIVVGASPAFCSSKNPSMSVCAFPMPSTTMFLYASFMAPPPPCTLKVTTPSSQSIIQGGTAEFLFSSSCAGPSFVLNNPPAGTTNSFGPTYNTAAPGFQYYLDISTTGNYGCDTEPRYYPSLSITGSLGGASASSGNFELTVNVSGMCEVTIDTSVAPPGHGYVTLNGAYETTPFVLHFVFGRTYLINAETTVACGSGCQYKFVSWSDEGAQSHTLMPSASVTTITANFEQQYLLTLKCVLETGTVTVPCPENVATPTGQTSGWYNAGTQISFTVAPDHGYTFVSWSISQSSKLVPNANVRFIITSAVTYTAIFEAT